MKDTPSAKSEEPMSLRRLDDPASKDFWEFVKKSTEDWRQHNPPGHVSLSKNAARARSAGLPNKPTTIGELAASAE
jgi:hypothetical protein